MTIRITDISRRGCAVSGIPTLTFYGPSGTILRTIVSHRPPGPGFRHATAVELRPSANPTAGFVVTSPGKTSNSDTCHAVVSLRISTPDVGPIVGDGLTHLIGYQLCGPGNPVDISVIASEATVDRYAPEAPDCLVRQLRSSIEALGAASGAAAYLGTVTNVSGATCTIDGHPRLTLRDAGGNIVLRFAAGWSAGTFPVPSLPRPVTLPTGPSARLEFTAGDFQPTAHGGRGARCPTSRQLEIGLPNGPGSYSLRQEFELCGEGGVGAFTEV